MRIGVIADTHIPDRAMQIPKQVLDDFKNADMLIHAGDLVELSVIETMKKACPDVKVVCGNMDGLEVRKAFPEKEIIKVGNYKIGIIHGYGPPNKLIDTLNEVFKNDTVDMIVYGHSHIGVVENIGNIIYFNPGSPTDKIFSPFNSYGIIEITDKIDAKIIKL